MTKHKSMFRAIVHEGLVQVSRSNGLSGGATRRCCLYDSATSSFTFSLNYHSMQINVYCISNIPSLLYGQHRLSWKPNHWSRFWLSVKYCFWLLVSGLGNNLIALLIPVVWIIIPVQTPVVWIIITVPIPVVWIIITVLILVHDMKMQSVVELCNLHERIAQLFQFISQRSFNFGTNPSTNNAIYAYMSLLIRRWQTKHERFQTPDELVPILCNV